MRIAIVGFDYQFLKEFSYKIAETFNLQLIDLQKLLDEILLDMNYPILIENEILQHFEKLLVQENTDKNNCVLVVPDNIFFSNKNYKLFENYLIILINSKNINKFKINIKKLIKNKKIIEINQEKFNLNEIISNIRGYYDR